jgi:MFS family permease
MVPFGAILLFSELHEFGAAGGALAACLIATSVTVPQRGRLVERFSPRTVLPLMALAFAAAVCLAALIAARACSGCPTVALLALANALAPFNTAVVRTVWPAIAADDQEAAHSTRWTRCSRRSPSPSLPCSSQACG